MTSVRTRTASRILIALPLALGTTAVSGPAAHAAAPSLVNVGGVATLTATEALSLGMYVESGQVVFSLNNGDFGAVTGCTQGFDAGIYRCSGVDRVVINGSPFIDAVSTSGIAVPMEIHAGAGDDTMNGGLAGDEIHGDEGEDYLAGDAGNDLVDGGDGDDNQVRGDAGDDSVVGADGEDRVYGGAGDDDVSGGADDDEVFGDDGTVLGSDFDDTDGDDTLAGDAGDDRLLPGGGSDVVNGGAGTDEATYEGFREDGEVVEVSLDTVANDGPVGESDNVGPVGDVENLKGPEWFGLDGVVLVGNSGANVLDASGTDSPVTVDGLGGDDEISAWGSDGETELDGGDGNDVVNASETDAVILGGAGDDELNGGGGNDQIDGGPGADDILAGDGNDAVEAVDGTVDSVSCGPDADTAHVDAADTLAIDVLNLCETKSVVQPPAPQVTVPTKKRYRLNAKGVASFALTNSSAFQVVATAVAKTSKNVGAGEVTLAADAAGKLGLKLNRAGRSVVNRKGSLKATVTFTLKGNGQTRTATRTVTFLKR